MNGVEVLLHTPPDRMPAEVLYPFAWDEWMCRQAGADGFQSTAHIWRHSNALVLGLRDRRLPYAAEAIAALRSTGCMVAVRNSGGAAVPLDAGVVNLSVVLPRDARHGVIDFHADFRSMAELIAEAVGEWSGGTQAGEIRGAYCPGDYDLSIGGRKFCGIAQRRQLRGYVVSAFIVVEGSGEERARRAQAFYHAATGGTPHPDDPGVRPESMASLEELAGIRSADAFADALLRRLQDRGGRLHPPEELFRQEADVRAVMDELRRRYDQ